MSWMCGLKQGMNEPIKVYYERMANISVKLEQYHGDHFGPGELSLMKKGLLLCWPQRAQQIPGISHEGPRSIQGLR